MSQRLLRVKELLKREIGELIRRDIPMDQAGLISVNEVAITSDLHTATIFVSVIGSDDQKSKAFALLQKHRKRFQSELSRSIVLKYTPRLKFITDDSIDRGNRVLSILEELGGSEEPADEEEDDEGEYEDDR